MLFLTDLRFLPLPVLQHVGPQKRGLQFCSSISANSSLDSNFLLFCSFSLVFSSCRMYFLVQCHTETPKDRELLYLFATPADAFPSCICCFERVLLSGVSACDCVVLALVIFKPSLAFRL